MRRSGLIFTLALALLTSIGFAWQAPAGGPYKVLRRAKVGGEGGTDYIFADSVGRRLYITRNATRGTPATDTAPAVAPAVARISVFNLDTLDLIDEIPDTGGNGATVCPNSGHGFATSHPDISMFDTKTVKLIKKIPLGKDAAGTQASGDGLYCDSFNDHAYIYSHPTKDATVIDAKDGTVLGVVDLGGTPEQSVADGKGTLYVVMQRESNVAVVDAKTMKVTAHLDFKDKGGSCNGLALDAKNKVLFVACGNSSMTPAQGQPAQPTMVVMSAVDGKILATLPLAGGSDGAAFNPETMEAFSAHGNGTMTIVKEKSPTSFEVEQNLDTMNGARTITFDSKTQHLFVMSVETAPPPPPAPGATPPAGGRGGGRGTTIPGSFTIVVVGK
jgi:hypothetical protein